jgi:hypothetical protein
VKTGTSGLITSSGRCLDRHYQNDARSIPNAKEMFNRAGNVPIGIDFAPLRTHQDIKPADTQSKVTIIL